MGAKRIKELNDTIYGGYEVDLGHVKLTKMKITITYGRLRGARGRLAGRYLHGGSKPIAQIVPRLRAVADASGKLIGAVADVKMAHMLAAKIALESEELQREFDPFYNERVRGLGERHIAVLGGLTRDLFPVNKRAAVTQMSAFNGNIRGSPTRRTITCARRSSVQRRTTRSCMSSTPRPIGRSPSFAPRRRRMASRSS